jgi:transcriptional regulator GlxA family with amidase domain
MPAEEMNRYRQIVLEIERLARSQMSAPLCITTLCRRVKISERMLRNAFRHIYGMPPHRCLRLQRMSAVREALRTPSSPMATVTQIATDHGFLELGRFSVEYRQMFGECPSTTLQKGQGDRRVSSGHSHRSDRYPSFGSAVAG